uniref:RWP-RK domain-containing protein n=1 Tax=Oryza punctata TaxID=4537 RepID=A0A0E0KTZ7_ORYPU
MDAAAAAVSTLSALAVFASTLDHDAGAVRSVHGYKVYGRGGRRRWERWVEREFVLTPASCREVQAPVAPPRILPAEWRGRPAYREGQVVAEGSWRCILAFDSAAAAVAPPHTPPPVLCPFLNPRLMCVPSLYNDLEKVFRFQNVEKIPKLMQCDSKEKLSRWDARDKNSDEVLASGSDSDYDLQSGAELKPTVQKQRRANKKHIASITLVDIAQYFHLPIREASRTLKIGVSILKRKCRQYNIPRWPHRKIKSLDSLIQDLEQEKHKQTEEEKQKAIMALTRRKQMLETEKETIQQIPAMDLKVETKQFREDVFKRRYRAKKDLAND